METDSKESRCVEHVHPEAIRKAMHLLVYKNRSEQELRDRLAQCGFQQEAVEEAIAYVVSFGYLNDKRYAESYAASFAGRKSRAAIRVGLRGKGVDERYIDEALEALPSDEQEVIASILRRRAGEPHLLAQPEMRRLSAYLARRGFSISDICRALRTYQKGTEDSAEDDERG